MRHVREYMLLKREPVASLAKESFLASLTIGRPALLRVARPTAPRPRVF